MTQLLTPSNRTAFEEAVERTSAERYPLPVEAIGALWSPDDCPAHLLSYLAFAMSLDLWREEWSETKKREAIRNSLALHRLKTTPAGIKAHVRLAGSEVRKIVRPPARSFLYAAQTAEQRALWLESLPQVRLYPFVRTAIAVRRAYASGPAKRFFHGAGFLRKDRGTELYGYRATYKDGDSERDISFDAPDASGTLRMLIGRTQKRSWHGRGFFGDHLTHSMAARGVVTLRFSDDVAGFAVSASLDPVDVRPTRVMQPRIAPIGRSFFGSRSRARFLCKTFASNLIYDKVSLNDPTKVSARRNTRAFHGVGRFGIRPFTAEIKIDVPMTRARSRSGRWHGAGFRRAPDMQPFREAIEAVRVAKAFRDTILIDTATVGRAEFGSGLRFGDFAFGDMRNIA